MGIAVTVALAPERAADATSLRAALVVVPFVLALAAAGLTLVRRAGHAAASAAA